MSTQPFETINRPILPHPRLMETMGRAEIITFSRFTKHFTLHTKRAASTMGESSVFGGGTQNCHSKVRIYRTQFLPSVTLDSETPPREILRQFLPEPPAAQEEK